MAGDASLTPQDTSKEGTSIELLMRSGLYVFEGLQHIFVGANVLLERCAGLFYGFSSRFYAYRRAAVATMLPTVATTARNASHGEPLWKQPVSALHSAHTPPDLLAARDSSITCRNNMEASP